MKVFLFFAILISTVIARASVELPVGQAKLTIHESGKADFSRNDAHILKDSIFVPQVNKTFTRYILMNYPPDGSLIAAALTLYVDDKGQVYSYFWDTGAVRSSSASFADDGGKFNNDSWIHVDGSDNSLSGRFYPGDSSEVGFQVEIDKSTVHLTLKERGTWAGVIPVWKKTVMIYQVNP